jgi:hypothetical protein
VSLAFASGAWCKAELAARLTNSASPRSPPEGTADTPNRI